MKEVQSVIIETIAGDIPSETSLSSTQLDIHPKNEIHRDGGKQGWLQVFACWLLFMNTWSD